MKSWPAPAVPAVPGHGDPLRLFDTQSRSVRPVDAGEVARMYVCGITPYDATHLGHAATYVTFDLVQRALRDAGHRVEYVQNVTDIDDPLLERAARDGEDWTVVAERETALFREDMTALRVLPPTHYVGAVEAMDEIAATVQRLLEAGAELTPDELLIVTEPEPKPEAPVNQVVPPSVRARQLANPFLPPDFSIAAAPAPTVTAPAAVPISGPLRPRSQRASAASTSPGEPPFTCPRPFTISCGVATCCRPRACA